MVKDLTQGKPAKVLREFSIPMFISVIFQQLYNIADSVIAGKFAGEDALAAVGASYPITMIFMAIAIGSNIGCSVVISQLFGAKRYEEMKTAITTTILTALGLSFLLSVAGLLGTENLMRMINTPGNIFADGALYLRIYVGGFTFLFLYNIATGIFTALGDSKTPLYFLIGSSLGNIVLDIIFVCSLHMGVAGVAWATFLAQGVACVLAVFTLWKKLKSFSSEKALWFSFEMLGRISKVAIPSILQQSFISVGNIFIQSLVNGFGSSVIAGYSAAVKLNTFTVTSFITLGNCTSNFTAQNVGAEKWERVQQGYRAAIKMVIVIALPFVVAYFFFGKEMLLLFMDQGSQLAMKTGVEFLKIVSPFYFVVAIKLIADGVLRGSSEVIPFMIATFADLILRVVLAYILAGPFGTAGVWVAWPIGWALAAIMSVIFYKSVVRKGMRAYNIEMTAK